MAVTGSFSHGTPGGGFEELSATGEARMECQQPMSDGGNKFVKWKMKTHGCLQCDKSCHLAGKTRDFQESRYKYIDLLTFDRAGVISNKSCVSSMSVNGFSLSIVH